MIAKSNAREVTLPNGIKIMVELTAENAAMYDLMKSKAVAYGGISVEDEAQLNRILDPIKEAALGDISGGKGKLQDPSSVAGATYYPEDSIQGTENNGKFFFPGESRMVEELPGLRPNPLTGGLELPPHQSVGMSGVVRGAGEMIGDAISNPLESALLLGGAGTAAYLGDQALGRNKFGIPAPEGETVPRKRFSPFPGKDKPKPNLTQSNYANISKGVNLDENPLTASDIVEGSNRAKAPIQKQLDKMPPSAQQAIKTGANYGLQTGVYPKNSLTAESAVNQQFQQIPGSSYIGNKLKDYRGRARQAVEGIAKSEKGKGLKQVNPDLNPVDSDSPNKKFKVPGGARTAGVAGALIGGGAILKGGYDYYQDQSLRAKREIMLQTINGDRLANGQRALTQEEFDELEALHNEMKEAGAY